MNKDFKIFDSLKFALDSVNSFVYIKDKESRYIYANKHTLELFGVSSEELFLSSDDRFFPEDVVKVLKKIDLVVLSGKKTENEIVVVQGGEKKIYHEVKTPIYSDENPDEIIALLGISTDITHQKKIEELALRLARTDELTKIANRYELNDIYKKEFLRYRRFKRPFSVIMFDLDFFKKVNDQHGHLIGDKCLVAVTEVVNENVRTIDTFGRWGGDEFLLICPETELSEATNIAEKLRKIIAENESGEITQITASFGVSTICEKDTVDSISKRADQALYAAKIAGRNKVVYK